MQIHWRVLFLLCLGHNQIRMSRHKKIFWIKNNAITKGKVVPRLFLPQVWNCEWT